MPRDKQVPYTCPRCGYYTQKKQHMHQHLHKSKKPCPAEVNIDLTPDIKDYILKNRIYHPPKLEPVPKPSKVKNIEAKAVAEGIPPETEGYTLLRLHTILDNAHEDQLRTSRIF